MSTPKTPNQSLNRLLLSHFSTLLHLIKSLPSTPSSVTRSEEEEEAEDAGGLLLMAVGESTKLLPWVMGARKHVRAYLKVGPFLLSALGSVPALSGLIGFEKRKESRESSPGDVHMAVY